MNTESWTPYSFLFVLGKSLVISIVNYRPSRPEASSWEDPTTASATKEDDGNGSKLVRAVSHGEQICKSDEDDPRSRVNGTMWQQLGNMGKRDLGVRMSTIGFDVADYLLVMDSVETRDTLGSEARALTRPGRSKPTSDSMILLHHANGCKYRFEDRPRAQL